MERKITLSILLVFVLASLSAATSFYIDDENKLKVYPNPATDVINIVFESEQMTTPEVQIIDLTGKEVKRFERSLTFEYNSYTGSLDISDLNQGVYFIKLVQGEKVTTKKLLVR